MAEETKTLVRWLIEKIDGEAYRRGSLCKKKHFQVDGKLLQALGGRESFLTQARELEKDEVLGKSGKITFDWRDVNTDIAKIHCSVDSMPELCRREGIEDPRSRQLRCISILFKWKEKAEDTWLSDYYDAEIRNLEEGNYSQTIREHMQGEYLYHLLDAILHLEEPIEKRVFSARVFKNVTMKERGKPLTPSKIFERKYEKKIISIMSVYSSEYVEGMSDDEVLKTHGILSYAQTLEWKGPLTYMLDDTVVVCTSKNRYGTIVGAQTLEHAKVKSLPGVKRIIIIENKANYEKMKFREDELYIFCHGFFSPKEVRFLKGIWEISDVETKYYHWGDLDYGGIRIFQFNKKNVFPGLRPWKMGKEDYDKAIAGGAGIPIEENKKEKLAKLDAGELEELKACILEWGLEIEQELLV